MTRKNMRVRLATAGGQQLEYSPEHGFEPPTEIPCMRCGVCCTKWQPPVDPSEAKKIARSMGISYPTFRNRYLQKYPMKDGYLIRREQDACIFLKFEDGLAGCSIHQFKPEACCNWKAGLEKTECQEGLRRKGAPEASANPDAAADR